MCLSQYELSTCFFCIVNSIFCVLCVLPFAKKKVKKKNCIIGLKSVILRPKTQKNCCMDNDFSVSVLSVADIPLLYSIIEEYKIGAWFDHHKPSHGNWDGASPGTVLGVWLCYLLTEQDHRLSPVESWVAAHLPLLRCLTGVSSLRSLDFTDDKLGILLTYFSKPDIWDGFICSLERDMLSVYRLSGADGVVHPTFRLDAAPMQSYGQAKESGLLQYGHNKQHQKTPQAKVKLCTLDNDVNHFAHPVCSLTVSGNTADDVLYIPIIEKLLLILAEHSHYAKDNLLVGDKKFGSMENRAFVVNSHNLYLCPLSLVQLDQQTRTEAIKTALKEPDKLLKAYHKPAQVLPSTAATAIVQPTKTPELIIARGFVTTANLQAMIKHTKDGQEELVQWTERRLYVHSVAFAAAQAQKLDKKLAAAEQQIDQLGIRKQGKSIPSTLEACQAAVDDLLKEANVAQFIQVKVEQTEQTRQIRAYKGNPARTETTQQLVITHQRNQDIIDQHKELLGWQVYATNATDDQLGFETCVWKYRQQANIESRLDDLRNQIIPLLPLYLHKDAHIIGIVNLITLAIKVCSVIEYKVAEALHDQKRAITGLYEGNPKRKTNKPSIKRILTAFQHIYITAVYQNGVLIATIITPLNIIQQDLLALMGKSSSLYNILANNIQICFSS